MTVTTDTPLDFEMLAAIGEARLRVPVTTDEYRAALRKLLERYSKSEVAEQLGKDVAWLNRKLRGQ